MRKLKELFRKYDEFCIRISVPFVLMYLDGLDKMRMNAENRMEKLKLEDKRKVNEFIRRMK